MVRPRVALSAARLLAACLALWVPLALATARPAAAAEPVPYPQCVITLEDLVLTPLEPGDKPENLPAYTALDLTGRDGDQWLAASFGPGGQSLPGRLAGPSPDLSPWPARWPCRLRVEGPLVWAPAEALEPAPAAGQTAAAVRVRLNALGRLPAAACVLAPGPAAFNAERLARLRGAALAPELKRRLAAGVIAPGDNLWQVELAWGRAPRSFMVNYFSDEQHFVYALPGGGPLILRFPGGILAGPPASKTLSPPKVASPHSPR